MLEGAPRVDEDTMPGELANVVSGRVANLLDLQGPNHAMDAACASSMAACVGRMPTVANPSSGRHAGRCIGPHHGPRNACEILRHWRATNALVAV